MLSRADNELLCRVGPGTPMGELLREYWFPAIPSFELPSPDCPPKRVRMLGEDLVAFRDSTGKVGLFTNSCPHRGASMFFGRNEEEGLRCVYHGWKFDVNGTCVDIPNMPEGDTYRDKIHIINYPVIEAGDIIWAYMGPAGKQPAFPAFEWAGGPTPRSE